MLSSLLAFCLNTENVAIRPIPVEAIVQTCPPRLPSLWCSLRSLWGGGGREEETQGRWRSSYTIASCQHCEKHRKNKTEVKTLRNTGFTIVCFIVLSVWVLVFVSLCTTCVTMKEVRRVPGTGIIDSDKHHVGAGRPAWSPRRAACAF